MARRVKIAVPASSANLGPGYDVLAAALDIRMEMEVVEAGEFWVDAGGLEVPEDETNLCVRAFAELHSVEELGFTLRGDIVIGAGLGSSGAAIVAGLVAANRMYGLGLGSAELHGAAARLEGHPDNVAASLYGGFVICAGTGSHPEAVQLGVPEGLEAVAVIPEERVSTEDARAALPNEVPLSDAIFNAASISLLILGLERRDWDLVARGLDDRLHQPHRAHLYRRSIELVGQARSCGALGATISGAGPAVVFWTLSEHAVEVEGELSAEVGDWAVVKRTRFAEEGAEVVA